MSVRSSLLLLCLHGSALELGAGLRVKSSSCTAAELQALVMPFESVDPRLVMISPDNDTLAAQEALISNGALDKLECAMNSQDMPMQIRGLGAELTSYLAVSNPVNRHFIGHIPNLMLELSKQVYYSVHFSHMSDVVLRNAENAAEAIAILAKADAENSAALVHMDAASDLAAMLERTDGEMTPKGYMWAAAALGNMMAEFDSPDAMQYAQEVQGQMAARPGFMHRLVNLTHTGTVQAGDPPETMPGEASRTEATRKFPRTYGWAVMHAIGKLALHPEGRAQLKAEPGAHELFCTLSMSPDSLEQSKAEAIVAIASWGCDGANNFLVGKPAAGGA